MMYTDGSDMLYTFTLSDVITGVKGRSFDFIIKIDEYPDFVNKGHTRLKKVSLYFSVFGKTCTIDCMLNSKFPNIFLFNNLHYIVLVYNNGVTMPTSVNTFNIISHGIVI